MDVETIVLAIRALGITREHIEAIRYANSYEEAEGILKGIQGRARMKFRKIASVFHPDVNGGSQYKSEFFILAKELYDSIQRARVTEKRFRFAFDNLMEYHPVAGNAIPYGEDDVYVQADGETFRL